MAAGGTPWSGRTPRRGDAVLDPDAHLRIAVPWLCSTLRAVTGHLAETGQARDARSTRCSSATSRAAAGSRGAPRACRRPARPGATSAAPAWSAGTWTPCTGFVGQYAATPPETPPETAAPAAVHRRRRRARPRPARRNRPPTRHSTRRGCSTPHAWTGGATGCTLPDPTGGRCVTGATRHGLAEVSAAFDGWKGGPVIRSAGCWDRHAWNPRSDHPQGRACDLFATRPGRFADGAELADGWRIARWFRGHAESLQVKYVIWQGRYWDPRVADQDGWGRRYSRRRASTTSATPPAATTTTSTSASGSDLCPEYSSSPRPRSPSRPSLLIVAGLVRLRGDEPGPPLGAVLDGSDRHALDAVPLRRGPEPPPADPAVDLTDPAAVARAYLAAARSATSRPTTATPDATPFRTPLRQPARPSGWSCWTRHRRGRSARPRSPRSTSSPQRRTTGAARYRATVATPTGPGEPPPSRPRTWCSPGNRTGAGWSSSTTPDLLEGDD